MEYTTLKRGSTGDDVKKLQTALGVTADGIYGEQTEAAVKQYQQSNGIGVDGIAGNTTLNKLYNTGTTTTNNTATTVTQPTNYDTQMQSIFDKLMNRESFSYDVSSDPLYQQYKDLYTSQGKAAMQDTMGQAAALTGGYGSSYAQSVGQQQYDAYLQQLNSVVPELYADAYERYENEGTDLYNQYSMLQSAEATQYERQQNEYSKLVSLISSTGYTPTEQELVNAGMSEAQAAAYLKAYTDSQSSGSGGGGGDGDEIDYYTQLRDTITDYKGVVAKKGASTLAQWREETVAAIEDALTSGNITSDEAAELKRMTRAGVGGR